MAGHPLFGELCDCGNLKGKQARVCQSCFIESTRGEDYWARRTCPDCGGPKSADRNRCRTCANKRRRGIATFSRVQPDNHPWRRAA